MDEARVSPATLLGLVPGDSATLLETQLLQLRQLAGALPWLGAVQLVGFGYAALAAPGAGGGAVMLIAAAAALMATLVAYVLAVASRRLQVCAIYRSLCVLAGLMGVGQAVAASQAAPAAVVGLGAAMLLSVLTLASLRAPAAGFLGGICVGMAVFAPPAALLGCATLAGGGLVALYALARADCRHMARAEARQRDSALATRLVREFEGFGTGWFWETDRTGRLTYISRKIAEEIGGERGALLGMPVTDVFQMDSASAETERTLSFHLSARASFSEYSVRAVNGAADRWWSISGRPIFDAFGQFRGFIGSGSDLTAKRRAEAEITRLALFDGLTGLANRQRMRLSLDQALSHQQKGGYRPTALFLLDLDRFKAVNDTLGHQVGDELLKQVAERLQRTVGDAGLVGRLGGDEFKVVLPGESDREKLSLLARAIISALSQPYRIGTQSCSIGCSVGIAIAPDHGETSETLIRNADLALYAAKGDGRGVHRFYREELLVGAQSRKHLEEDLRRAITEGEFFLAYQPVVSTVAERIVGFEALIRWRHPQRGLISPAEFVPVAEDCGLIERIGEWVLRTACQTAVTWPPGIRVAVNVSPIQFRNPAFPGIVANALASAGLEPARLELEITEGVFVQESATTDQNFEALKGLGVRLALDDFGTGYSSLGYLKKAPFDKIKIDQSFVRGAAVKGSRNAAIVKAIVALADTLGMETTAEGVEIQDEVALIRSLGCSHIQGYVYGKPMEAVAVAERLAESGETAIAQGHRVSRAPRTRMLRLAEVEAGGRRHSVRIRNMSTGGALLEGARLDVGQPLALDLLDGFNVRATVRWVREHHAGVEFAEAVDLTQLAPIPPPVKRVA